MTCAGLSNPDADPLVAACDVLVIRALERVGNDLLAVERSRRGALNGRARHEAHLRWQPEPDRLDKALRGAWEHVPYVVEKYGAAGLSVDEVVATLDRHVRDLIRTMTGHSTAELEYRMAAYVSAPGDVPCRS